MKIIAEELMFFSQPVYASRESLEILKNPPKIPEYRQIVWGQPKPVHAKPLKNRMEFEDVTVEVIETPGHSFDHVSFLIDEKLLVEISLWQRGKWYV